MFMSALHELPGRKRKMPAHRFQFFYELPELAAYMADSLSEIKIAELTLAAGGIYKPHGFRHQEANRMLTIVEFNSKPESSVNEREVLARSVTFMFDLLTGSHMRGTSFNRVERLEGVADTVKPQRVDFTIEATVFDTMIRSAPDFSSP